MHKGLVAVLARAGVERDPGDVLETQVGDVTVLHTSASTHSAREGAVALSGEEFLASSVAVDLQEVC